ncbi:hypothetical protein HPP92_009769 [Vanilla planifolia]|uniref:Uncharacterized protein n=1 Tax=Vanilla planifolia TaxID=51239 RepID=A0A835V504_VANPL|nr:hypothetical protein HPP92_009769 [Vanilla planifolia]
MPGAGNHHLCQIPPTLHVSRHLPFHSPHSSLRLQESSDPLPFHILHPRLRRRDPIPQVKNSLVQQHLRFPHHVFYHKFDAFHHIVMHSAAHSSAAFLPTYRLFNSERGFHLILVQKSIQFRRVVRHLLGEIVERCEPGGVLKQTQDADPRVGGLRPPGGPRKLRGLGLQGFQLRTLLIVDEAGEIGGCGVNSDLNNGVGETIADGDASEVDAKERGAKEVLGQNVVGSGGDVLSGIAFSGKEEGRERKEGGGRKGTIGWRSRGVRPL